MPQVSFHPGFHGAVLLLTAGVGMLLVALFYARAYASLRTDQWTRLYVLRVTAILIVLLLLFRPLLSFQREVRQRRQIVFLVDQSASMGIADDADGGTRLEHAASRLLEWLERLKRNFDFQLITFSDSALQLEQLEQLHDLKPTGKATSLSRALAAAGKAAPPRDVEAIFLLSDGIHNSAGDPLQVAGRLGVPVHTIGTGNTLRDRLSYRDVRVVDLDCPDQLALDNRARLKGYIDAVGFPGRVVNVVLQEDDRQVAEQELTLDDVEGPQEVLLEFTPTTKGLHTYTVQVPQVPEEKIVENNQRSASTLVVDARIRLLYLEGTLRAEYGALVGRFLSKDPNVEFCALVQTRPNVFTQRANIEGLDLRSIPNDPELLQSFDVFIIGDLDSSYLQPAQMELMAQRVRDGAGLLMTGGYHSLGPGGYGSTPLADVLPLFVGDRDIGQLGDPFQPQLTPSGRQHPIFANISQFFARGNQEAAVEGLPPLEGCVAVQGVKPGATVLAQHPSQLIDGRAMPVMAVQAVGSGRAAIFTGDTTRNWHQALRTLDRETPFLRFWGQTVRWLAGRSEEVPTEAGLAATTDKAYYQPESQITVTAVVRGPQGEAAEAAQVTASVQGPAGESFLLTLTAAVGPAGNYRATFEPQQSGRYEISVEAQLQDTAFKADTLIVDVGRPNLEFDRLDLDEKQLIAIANETGGRYTHIITADRLIDRLKRHQQKRRVQYEVPLYWPPLFWVLFVGVLTAEWLLRRRYRLR